MAHQRASESFARAEREIAARAVDPDWGQTRALVEEIVLHLGDKMDSVRRRTDGSRGGDSALARGDTAQLLELHRRLSETFVRLASAHAILDCIDGAGDGALEERFMRGPRREPREIPRRWR